MSNPKPRKVSLAFDAPGLQEFVRNLKAVNQTLGEFVENMIKAGTPVEDMLDSLKGLGAAGTAAAKGLGELATATTAVSNAQTKAVSSNQRLVDLEIAYQRALGNTTKAQELNAQAQQDSIDDEERVLRLKIQAIDIEKDRVRLVEEASKATLAARAPVTQQQQDTDLAKRNAEQERYIALSKQREEADLAAAKARATRMAAEQKQLEETDLLRAKSGAKAISDAQKQADSDIKLALIKKEYTQALELNLKAQQEEGISIERLNKLKQQQAQIENNIAGKPTSALQEARGARDALFALGLTINAVTTELGSQLPPAAQKASSSIKIVADSMLAGAYFGGVYGAVLGALAGVALSVGAALLTVDPQIKALNDSLDKLGKKDDAAQGLAKLAGISDNNAQAALDYLKANQDLAASFQAQAQAAQGAIPVLQGIGDAARAAGDAFRAATEAARNFIPAFAGIQDIFKDTLPAIQNGIIFSQTYNDALRSGKTTLEAVVLASNAARAAQNAQAVATAALAKQTQAYADIQNEINNTTNRVALQNAQDTVDKLRLEGASADELRLAYIKLAQAKRDANGISPSDKGARNYAISPITSEASGLQSSQANDYSFLNATATKLAKDLLAIQKQYNADSAQLSIDHTARLDEIGSNGYEQQLRIEREFGQRRDEIQAQYDQDTKDAYSDYRERVDNLEADAGKSRNKIAQDYADKRAQIEQDYQDKVAQIQSDYQLSLFDIGNRFDANALIRARMQRDKALADAQKARDKDNKNADKTHDQQEKDLAESLANQKKQLDLDYARRQRDLLQAYNKQNATNQQNYRDQIADLNDSIAKQYAAENAGYKKSQAALDKANHDKVQALFDALQQIKGVGIDQAKAIVKAIGDALDPSLVQGALEKFQKAIDADIKVIVTPYAPSEGSGNKSASGASAAPSIGNQSGYGTPGSTTQSVGGMGRTSLPQGNRVTQSATNGRVNIYIDNAVNSPLLNSQIRTTALGVTAEVINRGRKGY